MTEDQEKDINKLLSNLKECLEIAKKHNDVNLQIVLLAVMTAFHSNQIETIAEWMGDINERILLPKILEMKRSQNN